MMGRPWSDQERRWVVIGGCVAALLLVLAFVVSPYLQALEGLERQQARSAELLAELEGIQSEVAGLRASLGRQPRATRGGSATSVVESTASGLGLRERLISLRPQTLTEGSEIAESLEAAAEKISLEELVRWLYAIENSSGGLQVSQLRLRKRFDNPEQFDATLLLVRYRAEESP